MKISYSKIIFVEWRFNTVVISFSSSNGKCLNLFKLSILSIKIDSMESPFKILTKCKGKLDCLTYEMLFIKELKPKLKQSD